MGTWTYYIVKMKMKELVKEVDFASEIYESKTLDDAIQRRLREGRVKKEITKYLAGRDDRFFSSIVVAALDGNPTFFPVTITDDERFALLQGSELDDAFGVLRFDGSQKYYALDGQHRLKSIKTLIEQDPDDPEVPEEPAGFQEEEVSVILLVRNEASQDEFLKSYRRVFSSLNRYAKPTDRDTNIIMDEDDWVAILTRRLLVEHDFFLWHGKASESKKLKTPGKNLRSGDSYFTTLQTLYAVNETLMSTPHRETHGYKTNSYKQFNPGEDLLDELFDELQVYWDALLAEVPLLKSDPALMRMHDPDADGADCLLFWPIGQELFAAIVRARLNRFLPDPDKPSLAEVREATAILSKVNWSLHEPPWKGLLLTYNEARGSWNMRSEDRKEAIRVANRILRLLTGIDDPTDDAWEELKTDWYSLLIPRPDKAELDADWESVVSQQLA